jgi:hypothetical protein
MNFIYKLFEICFNKKTQKNKEENISFILFNLPFFLLDNENKYNNECIICYELFEDLSIVSMTTCRHICHKDCLSKWIVIKQTCPYCIKKFKI